MYERLVQTFDLILVVIEFNNCCSEPIFVKHLVVIRLDVFIEGTPKTMGITLGVPNLLHMLCLIILLIS